MGGGLFLPGDPPTYSVTALSTSVYEGGTVSFAVTTTNVGIGTTLYYSIVGSASSSDFLDNSLTGSFNIQGISGDVGFVTFTKTIKIDESYTEDIEGFRLNILTGSPDGSGSIVATSSTVYINNLGNPTYSIGVSTTTVNEGGSVNFTVNTVNVGSGTTLYYSTGGSMEALTSLIIHSLVLLVSLALVQQLGLRQLQEQLQMIFLQRVQNHLHLL